MKKFLMMTLFAIATPFVWAFSLDDLNKTLQQPQSVQGAFVQQRYLKSMNTPMSTQGKFVLLPQKGLLWQMTKPFDNRLRVRADGIMQWDGKTWRAQSGSKAAQNRQVALFLDLLGGNTQGLAQAFDMQLSGSEKKWTLRLLPKTMLMKQVFEKIDISGDSVVRRIELNEKQGDKTVMQFSDVSINADLDAFARNAL